MAIEDLLLNVGSSVSDSELDSLAGKMESIDILEDKIDEIDIDVDVDGDEEAIAELSTLEALAENIDNIDIDISSGISGATDGGGSTDGGIGDGSSRDTRFDRLNLAQLEYIRDSLGDQFDWRGMIRDDLTMRDLQPGVGRETLFEFPKEINTDSLVDTGRESSGLETLLDDDAIDDIIDEEGLAGVFASDADRRRSMVNLPGDRDDTPLLDRLLGGRDRKGNRSGGMLRPFANLQMSKFYNILAQLLPLLLVFIGALPAAIVAIGALAVAALGAAGALAAIGGLGALGFAAAQGDGDLAAGMQELLKTIKRDFLNAFLPLADRFDDVFSDALDGLGELFDAIAAQGDVLVQFKDEARAFGGFIMDFLPTAISLMVQFGDAFSPIFGMFGDWLNMNFDDILGGLADVFVQALPSLLRFIDAFIAFLPFLMDLSVGFLIATSYIMEFFGMLGQIMGALGPVSTGIAVMIGLLVGLASIVSLATGVYGVFAGMLAGTALEAIWSYVAAIWIAITAEMSFIGTTMLAIFAVSMLTGGLILLFGALGSAASGFSLMSGEIDKATKSLNQFSSARSGFDGGMGGSHTSGLSEGTLSVYNDNSKTVYSDSGDDREKQRREQRRSNYRKKMFSPTQ